jgi:hypothetical protein
VHVRDGSMHLPILFYVHTEEILDQKYYFVSSQFTHCVREATAHLVPRTCAQRRNHSDISDDQWTQVSENNKFIISFKTVPLAYL